ncbi:hypothetical protein [Caudoviricetes sp.]|nr:hypothetical protein [Caudoviricetes sp.]
MAIRQFTVVNVGNPVTTTKGSRSYHTLEVIYKDDQGKAVSKKLVSFANPKVYEFVSNLEAGAVFYVELVKEGDYWQWKQASSDPIEGGSQPSPAAAGGSKVSDAKGSTRVVGSNYESKEERQVRQVMIVRQSSLANAVATLAIGSKSAPTPEAVIAVAKEYEKYVLGNIDTLISDIVE